MEATITVAERSLSYSWKRSARRRTTTITIDPERGVVVHTPRNYPLGRVESLLFDKSLWIFRHLERMAREQAARPARSWEDGALLTYRGEHYNLEVTEGHAPEGVWLGDGRIHVALRAPAPPFDALSPAERTRERVLAWFRERAREVVTARVAYFQEQTGSHPVKVRIKAQKRRWGSCSAKGALNFNWKLILAPSSVLDYVVVHELCHLIQLNHSPRFWAQVERVLPDYQEPRAWLRQQGGDLEI